MKKFLLAGAFALASIGSVHASEFQHGDWVLAQWKGSEYWFPGVVQDTRGNSVSIRYDDGTVESRPSNQVKPYNWHVGSIVQCQWKSGTEWYRGEITQLGEDGESLSVRYDDGDRERTRTGKCRSR